MTKSIEEQAVQYAYTKVSSKQNHNFHYAEQGYVEGAKAREEQLMGVVNELRESINHIIKNKNVHPYEYHHYTRENIISLLSADLTKADQMLKEMGIE